MSTVLRVLLLGPYPPSTAGSQRYRWEQYIPDLQRDGIALTVRGFQSFSLFKANQHEMSTPARFVETLRSFTRTWQHVREALSYDVVVVHREIASLGPPFFERWLYKKGVRLIYDFDDALYAGASRWIKRLAGWQQKIGEIISFSHHTLAGSPVLLEFARQFSDRVTLMPTVPYPASYPVPEKPAAERVVVGWSGGVGTSAVLRDIAEPLRQLQREHNIAFHVAGNAAFALDGMQVTASDWTFPIDDRQVWTALRPYDIGLMPLRDNAWDRAKCGFKALLYMSMGISPVVSPIGVNADIVQDGINGFWARTEAEWHDKIKALVTHPALRKDMGQKARQTIEERWSAARQVSHLARVLREVASTNVRH